MILYLSLLSYLSLSFLLLTFNIFIVLSFNFFNPWLLVALYLHIFLVNKFFIVYFIVIC